MRIILYIAFLLVSFNCFSQKQGNNWCFPRNCRIDWNDSLNPIIGYSNFSYPAQFSNSTFSSIDGQLKLYGGGTNFINKGGSVFGINDSLIENGDSLKCYPFSGNGALLLPVSDSIVYFIGITRNIISGFGVPYCYYSIINTKVDSVILKNEPLDTNAINEKLAVVRHANGRDWWLVMQKTFTNGYLVYLLSHSGFVLQNLQVIGNNTRFDSSGFLYGQMVFSLDGTKLVAAGVNQEINIFDFDRCTGQLSNFISAGENIPSTDFSYFGLALSPDNSKIYVATSSATKKLWQFDLNASNIITSKTLINEYPDTGAASTYYYGHLAYSPNQRLLITKGRYLTNPNNTTGFNTGLDEIKFPNNLSSTCQYSSNQIIFPTSFSVGGLPNMPNYQLGPVVGSLCDTIFTGVVHQKLEKYITVYPNPSGGVFNFELKQAGDAIRQIKIYNSQGELLPEQPLCGGTCSTIDMGKQPTGLYYYRCTTATGKTYTGKLLRE
ncbi:MAG: hypothetical protein RIQ89_149 [Bacteroidota bacterium]|jgi:hypothetical protein